MQTKYKRNALPKIIPHPPLTRMETNVAFLIAEGLVSKEIASYLGLSLKTVESHRQNALNRLGLHGVALLTRWAVASGLVSFHFTAPGSSSGRTSGFEPDKPGSNPGPGTKEESQEVVNAPLSNDVIPSSGFDGRSREKSRLVLDILAKATEPISTKEIARLAGLWVYEAGCTLSNLKTKGLVTVAGKTESTSSNPKIKMNLWEIAGERPSHQV